MGTKYVLTPELRAELKKPLGALIKGPSAATMKKLKEKAAKDNPPIVVSVGDTVSKNLYRYNFCPKLAIVDNKRMRRNVQTTELQATKVIHVQNPQGTLTEEAINATREAIEDKNSVEIVVDGEEDLLALIAIAYAPQNSYIVYGQPLEGIVVVKATPDKKAEIAAILGAMEKGSKN
jgi:uncharacterized protein (UPF0218 family)